MKFPVIRKSYALNIIILIFSLFASWFTLLFGISHLIEAIVGPYNPGIPYFEIMMGWIIVVTLCLLGVLFLLIAFSSFQGIIYKIKKKQPSIN